MFIGNKSKTQLPSITIMMTNSKKNLLWFEQDQKKTSIETKLSDFLFFNSLRQRSNEKSDVVMPKKCTSQRTRPKRTSIETNFSDFLFFNSLRQRSNEKSDVVMPKKCTSQRTKNFFYKDKATLIALSMSIAFFPTK